ncbi:MAG: ATP-binding protein [Cyanobacteria bacterium P01_E01_bin.42]
MSSDNWYRQNLQILYREVNRIRDLLLYYIERGEADAEGTQEDLPAESRLGQLVATFNLSSFERDVLLMAAGLEIDPSFNLYFAKAQGKPTLNYPTLSLAIAALPTAQWQVVSRQSALHYWRLIQCKESNALTHAPFKIDRHILSYLLGQPSLDEILENFIVPFSYRQSPESLLPSREKLVSTLTTAWTQAKSATELPQLHLIGIDGRDRAAIARSVGDRFNLRLYTLCARSLPSNISELHELCRHWEREALLHRAVLAIDCDDILADSPPGQSLKLFLERVNSPTILSGNLRQQFSDRNCLSLEISQLPHAEKRHLWETHLGDRAAELNGHLEPLIAQFNLNSHIIQAACASAGEGDRDLPSQLWDFCRLQARPHLDNLAQRIESDANWEDLVLPEREKGILRALSAQVKQRFRVYEEWGFSGKGRRGLGISALFAGASGTGKTMAAEVIAKEFNLDLYRIDLSAVTSKYIGETEKNLRRIFDAAEAGGAVLLFDEADALFGKRTQVKDSHDRHANIEVSYLLQRMEAYQGLAVLTTNLKDSLDQAFLRRIRFILNFPFPKADARGEIWRRIFPKQTPTNNLDYRKLGQLSVAGGNIRSIALNAAFLAADAGEAVMMKHVKQAAQTEYLKLGRSLTSSETQGWG